MNSKKTISVAEVNSYFLIFYDIKKELHYDKHTGVWGWSDKAPEYPSDYHWGFNTALDAVYDAIEPYINDDDEV